jgi:hypothetical protein
VASDPARVLAESNPTIASLPSKVSKTETLIAARAMRVKLLRQLGRSDEIPRLPPISAAARRPGVGVVCGLTFALTLVLIHWQNQRR